MRSWMRRRAKEMLQAGDSMENAAVLLSSSLVAIYPFNDGNERTAKFLLAIPGYGSS